MTEVGSKAEIVQRAETHSEDHLRGWPQYGQISERETPREETSVKEAISEEEKEEILGT